MSLNFYSEEEDNDKEESINNYKNLFLDYEKKTPSLKEALIQMFKSAKLDDQRANFFVRDIIDKCEDKINQRYNNIKNKYNNITKEDAYIICSYTYQLEEDDFSPYKLLNKNLVSDDRQNGIRKISKYLFILLKTLKKLPRYYPKNKYLYRCIDCHVKLSAEPKKPKFVPYIIGNKKTFWGFTSTSTEPEEAYKFLTQDKEGTIFRLEGDLWGYDIGLFSYYQKEKEILLEPERKFIVEDILPPLKGIINITCTILKTNSILSSDNEEDMNNEIDDNNNNDSIIKKYIVRLEMEAKINEKKEYTSGIGILCNIPSKKLKALITFNNILNLVFLNKTKKMVLHNNNNQEIEIDMTIDRYKCSIEELDITIIEILDKDNIGNFIEIDKFINSRNYTDSNIIYISLRENMYFDSSFCKIKEKNNNNNYICSIKSNKEGIIILRENNKLIGLINNNEIITMNKIINKIHFIKCIYNIKKEDIGNYIQIINYKDLYGKKNEEIEKEIKVIINGEIQSYNLEYKFYKEGDYIIYLIFYNILTNMSGMFSGCSSLKELNLSSFDTNQVTNMSYMFSGCSSLKKLKLSSFDTNQVTDMSFMFCDCSSLKELNLSSFNTNQVTNMQYMFSYCSSLEELNLFSFNTNQVRKMNSMFRSCSSLKKLNLTSFIINHVTYRSNMFIGCSSLKELNCKDDKILREFSKDKLCIII